VGRQPILQTATHGQDFLCRGEPQAPLLKTRGLWFADGSERRVVAHGNHQQPAQLLCRLQTVPGRSHGRAADRKLHDRQSYRQHTGAPWIVFPRPEHRNVNPLTCGNLPSSMPSCTTAIICILESDHPKASRAGGWQLKLPSSLVASDP